MKYMNQRADDRLADVLRQRVAAQWRPGDCLPSVVDLAREYGVCVNTVRAAIGILRQQGLVDVRHGKGCFVCAPPTEGKHVAILSECDVLGSPREFYHRRAMWGLRHFCEERSIPYRIYIGLTTDDPAPPGITCRAFNEDAAAGRISGVAAVATLANPEWVAPLRAKRVPVVGLDDSRYDAVVQLDQREMVRQGVRFLTERGRRRLALMAWGGGSQGFAGVFREEMERLGLPYIAEWVKTDLAPRAGAGWEELREVWASRRERPDGLLVCDDVLFQDAAIAMHECRVRVPEDLTIVTHANRGGPFFSAFPVARLVVDPEVVAHALGLMLLTLLRGERLERTAETIRAELEVPRELQFPGASALRERRPSQKETDNG